MRGGICFPLMRPALGGVVFSGYAVLCGVDVETKNIYVFEERAFTTALAYNGQAGLDAFLLMAWRKYFCDTWFHLTDAKVFRKYILPVMKSKREQLEKKLVFHFPELDINQEKEQSLILELISLNRLFYRSGGLLHKALQDYQGNVKPISHNIECLALLYALYGLELIPYVKKEVKFDFDLNSWKLT
jgi:hypothetical protein